METCFFECLFHIQTRIPARSSCLSLTCQMTVVLCLRAVNSSLCKADPVLSPSRTLGVKLARSRKAGRHQSMNRSNSYHRVAAGVFMDLWQAAHPLCRYLRACKAHTTYTLFLDCIGHTMIVHRVCRAYTSKVCPAHVVYQ